MSFSYGDIINNTDCFSGLMQSNITLLFKYVFYYFNIFL